MPDTDIPLPEPFNVASTIKCTACGAPYEPGRNPAPHAAQQFPWQPTSSRCKCGNTQWRGTLGESPSPAIYTADQLRARDREWAEKLAAMQSDRDSWQQQASDRVGDALEFAKQRDDALARLAQCTEAFDAMRADRDALNRQLLTRESEWAGLIDKARADEREVCAKVCDAVSEVVEAIQKSDFARGARGCAVAIRGNAKRGPCREG